MQAPNFGQGQLSQPQVQLRTNFQSIEDFMKEQEALDSVKAAEMKARAKAALANSNPKKVRKVPIDVEAAAAEARAVAEIGETNWTGRLLEYRNAHPPHKDVRGLFYNETEHKTLAGPRFKCSVKILEADQEFTDPNVLFTRKKEAKQYVSKKAIDWLIEYKYMPADGSVKFPKLVVQPTPKVIGPQVPKTSATKTPKGPTFASQIPDMCFKLGFNQPKYEIEKTCENPALYKGYAHFQDDPRVEDSRIGEVVDVFGKTKVKEAIAEEVLAFLKDIERQRLELNGEDDRKRKRSVDSLASERSREKSVKLDESVNLEDSAKPE